MLIKIYNGFKFYFIQFNSSLRSSLIIIEVFYEWRSCFFINSSTSESKLEKDGTGYSIGLLFSVPISIYYLELISVFKLSLYLLILG